MSAETTPAPAAPAAPAQGVGLWTMLVAAVIVVILLLYAVTYTVPAGSVAVLKTFGRVQEGDPQPAGLHRKWPAPIQTVQIVDQRERLLEIRNVELTMANQFNVHVVTTIGWRVKNPLLYVTAQPNEALMEETLKAVVGDARATVSLSVKLDDLVTVGENQRANYEAFEKRYRDTINRNLDERFGVEVTGVYISGLALPESATSTVQESMAAQRRATAEKYKQDGETEAARIKTRAETEANQMLAEASAEAVRVRGRGDAESAEYYKIFTQSPEAAKLANLFKSLEALETAVTSKTVIMMPSNQSIWRVMDDGAGE